MSSLFSHTVVDVIFSANNGCEFAPVADATTHMPEVANKVSMNTACRHGRDKELILKAL